MESPLSIERKNASFDPREMTYLLYGGEKRVLQIEKVKRYVEEDPVFRNGIYFLTLFSLSTYLFLFLDDIYTLDRYSVYKRGLEKSKHLVNRIEEIGLGDREDMEVFWEAVDMNLPINLHYAMFVPTIMR